MPAEGAWFLRSLCWGTLRQNKKAASVRQARARVEKKEPIRLTACRVVPQLVLTCSETPTKPTNPTVTSRSSTPIFPPPLRVNTVRENLSQPVSARQLVAAPALKHSIGRFICCAAFCLSWLPSSPTPRPLRPNSAPTSFLLWRPALFQSSNKLNSSSATRHTRPATTARSPSASVLVTTPSFDNNRATQPPRTFSPRRIRTRTRRCRARCRPPFRPRYLPTLR